jgi:quercetin dioxygenase-like cupin family protein
MAGMTGMTGEWLWFLDSAVRVRLPTAAGSDGLSIIEHRAPPGGSAPLHLHRTEDEIFHVLDGEIRFVVEGEPLRRGAGDIILVPRGARHGYRVESEGGARFLTITARGDFERFVRAVSQPAPSTDLPPRAGPPSPEAAQALAEQALRFGIEIIGPPPAAEGPG